VLGPFHIKFQKINLVDPLASQKLVAPNYRALDRFSTQFVRVVGKRRMRAGRWMVFQGERSGVGSQSNSEALNALMPGGTVP